MKNKEKDKNKIGKIIGIAVLVIIIGSAFVQAITGETAAPKTNVSDEDSAYKNINFIKYDDFKHLYDNSDSTILVLGQTGCGYCTQYKPIIDEIAKEENLDINYLDISNLSETEWSNLMKDLDSYFKDNEEWGTPLTLIV
jgi:thiol-disulfide isomerase/thioredoxin